MADRPPLPRSVWVLGIVSLLTDLSSEVYHALLPAFLTVTLGLSVTMMGLIDGITEGTAHMAKLVSGRLSDRKAKRKPWIMLGYGLSALSKPLFPLAEGLGPVLGARFADRVGKGIRGAPRDALIADETPPDQRGAAFGLRHTLDTVGGFLAPLAAVGLILWLDGDIRTVFWIAVIPAVLSFLVVLFVLKESTTRAPVAAKARWGGLRDLDKPVVRLLQIGFLFGLARFSEGFLILKAIDAGLAVAWSPLVLAVFALSFLVLAYPAGTWSDRHSPKTVLLAGIALLVVADLVLALADGLPTIALGVVLWGAHMALTQGIFSRMIADAASADKRATSFGAFFFVSGVAAVLASVAAGYIWDRDGPAMTFIAGAVAAAAAGMMLSLLPEEKLAPMP